MSSPAMPRGMESPSVSPRFAVDVSDELDDEVELKVVLSWGLGVELDTERVVEVERVENLDEAELEEDVQPLWQP